jgi:hypothetical protein
MIVRDSVIIEVDGELSRLVGWNWLELASQREAELVVRTGFSIVVFRSNCGEPLG